MATLDRNHRRSLEAAVRSARRAAESGAKKALDQLAVHHHEPWGNLGSDQRALRNRLRARARQLGDARDSRRETQATDHLIQECAYEHWHRLLFARFLAENDVLIEPTSKVPISIDECRELAREKGIEWMLLASKFAQEMLPQIFRREDPVLEVQLPPESRQELESILDSLPKAVFTAEDSLGWVYQYWQQDSKEAINTAGVKIGADELPAVTQLFTEDYMVLFLLQNTIGAWWAAKRLNENQNLASSAASEEDLRRACSLPGYNFEYLRFTRTSDGHWTPAAGKFETWPRRARDLRVLDPSMGSGHFLVFSLSILCAIRKEEEKLSDSEAIDSVLKENIFGLEIDPRCTQIAAFNLALASWKKVGYRTLPQLQLACSGLSVGASEEDWKRLGQGDHNLRIALSWLYQSFEKAPTLGSLLNPRRTEAAKLINWSDLSPRLRAALSKEAEEEIAETAVAANGLVKAAEILSSDFSLVITNVPYLGRGKQNDIMKEYCGKAHPLAKADLSTCFIERCLDFCAEGGSTALVTPQNWTFLGSYAPLRRNLLASCSWSTVVRLGPAAFEDMNWWAANTALFTLTRKVPEIDQQIFGLDVSAPRDPKVKSELLKTSEASMVAQQDQDKNPDARILLSPTPSFPLLQEYAESFQGISPADFAHYGRFFWEVSNYSQWKFWQGTIEDTVFYGGRELILWWNADLQEAVDKGAAYIRGEKAWNKIGVVVRQMRHLPCTLYTGEHFDTNCAVIVPKDQTLLPAIWAFCSSGEYHAAVRKIDQKTNVTNATLVKVPFDVESWKEAAEKQFPSGLPTPSSSDPTQWIFSGQPFGSTRPLHVGVARLLGFRWPRQTGVAFFDCPSVSGDELDKFADEDGVVPLSPLRGEASASDRLVNLMACAFGKEWSAQTLNMLLQDEGFGGRSLDDWLRNGFFEQHCDLFYQRPFVWHIWDGLKDGFGVLVNCLYLTAPEGAGKRTLEKIIYTYLGDWIERQRSEQAKGVEGADTKVAAAEHLKSELIKVLEGEPPYDIFVRWKPVSKQPLGWEPDQQDGIRTNIRPFALARVLAGRTKSGGILRTMPRIHWEKDRGVELGRSKEEFPWFWKWDGRSADFSGNSEFDGNRWNDLHYSREFKAKARSMAQSSSGGRQV